MFNQATSRGVRARNQATIRAGGGARPRGSPGLLTTGCHGSWLSCGRQWLAKGKLQCPVIRKSVTLSSSFLAPLPGLLPSGWTARPWRRFWILSSPPSAASSRRPSRERTTVALRPANGRRFRPPHSCLSVSRQRLSLSFSQEVSRSHQPTPSWPIGSGRIAAVLPIVRQALQPPYSQDAERPQGRGGPRGLAQHSTPPSGMDVAGGFQGEQSNEPNESTNAGRVTRSDQSTFAVEQRQERHAARAGMAGR